MFFFTFLPKLLNMSLTAGVVIVVVLLLRLLLKKAPKVIPYALWGIVLFRLLCPVAVTSDLSLFGFLDTPAVESGALTSRIEYVPSDIVHTEYPEIALPLPGADGINDTLPQGEEQLGADPLAAPITIAVYVWMAGVIGMGVYAAVSYLQLRKKLVTASPLRENIYLADDITSPFVMGLFRPNIYLPSAMGEKEQSYILMHEQYHIRRFDHVIKALAFAALCIHWFNPLVWVAFIMAGRDMEMSCDEAVIKKMGDGVLADYTASLLSLATGKHIIAGMPLAFGEGDTKDRIRNLANWKKPAFVAVLVAVIACAVLAVCLMTNPRQSPLPFELGNMKILWAKTLDLRPNEPLSYDLGSSDLDELKSRLSDLWVGKKDDDLGGFTPYYSVSIQANGYYFSIRGFDSDGKNTALYYEGEYYRIRDRDFGDYVQNLCAGVSYIDIQPLLNASDELADMSDEPADMSDGLVPGTSYVTDRCIYMNPLSSLGAFDGDNGYTYTVADDCFEIVHRDNGARDSIGVASWQWQPFPYTDEEWAALYIPPQGFEKIDHISEQYKNMRYLPLDKDHFLLKTDDALWLAELHSNDQMGTYLWSVFSLVPER